MKIFREMVRSTAMGADAIDHLMPYVEDEGLMQVMREQRETLHGFLCTAKGEPHPGEAPGRRSALFHLVLPVIFSG